MSASFFWPSWHLVVCRNMGQPGCFAQKTFRIFRDGRHRPERHCSLCGKGKCSLRPVSTVCLTPVCIFHTEYCKITYDLLVSIFNIFYARICRLCFTIVLVFFSRLFNHFQIKKATKIDNAITRDETYSTRLQITRQHRDTVAKDTSIRIVHAHWI